MDPSAAPRRRVDVLCRHVTAGGSGGGGGGGGDGSSTAAIKKSTQQVLLNTAGRWHGVDPLTVDVNVVGEPLPPQVRGKILHFMDQLTDTRAASGYDVAQALPGPTQDVGPGKRYPTLKDLLLELQRGANSGFNHVLWDTYQERYCGGRRTANFVQPVVSFTRKNARPPIIANQVVISDPRDAMRIARAHVQKMPDQALFLRNGVLSQVDNQRWKEQRGHMTTAFLPYKSLQYVLPVSERRAKQANGTLRALAAGGATVQLNEFLLNETMAQLMLAMFGMPEDAVVKHNKPVRDAFSNLLEMTGGTGTGSAEEIDPERLQKYSMRLFEFLGDFLGIAAQATGVQEAIDAGDPQSISGPLSARIFDVADSFEEKVFNAATFVFAGHDTTANTMSWLIFEACQNRDIQGRLQREADAFFASVTGEGGAIAYDDLRNLPYMTRCIAETLRLWPVVPNGTFRTLQYDDVVKGPDGVTDVPVKKGTFVQIPNWMRHRSEELWGPDVLAFNPDRTFHGNELWGGETFAGFNPQSERYSPFTYTPRDCMGKNFAQMEMRVILAYLFHEFDFSLAGSSEGFDRKTFLGVNRATLGPRDLGVSEDSPAELALYVKVKARR
jgi:cytochrome P450